MQKLAILTLWRVRFLGMSACLVLASDVFVRKLGVTLWAASFLSASFFVFARLRFFGWGGASV